MVGSLAEPLGRASPETRLPVRLLGPRMMNSCLLRGRGEEEGTGEGVEVGVGGEERRLGYCGEGLGNSNFQ